MRHLIHPIRTTLIRLIYETNTTKPKKKKKNHRNPKHTKHIRIQIRKYTWDCIQFIWLIFEEVLNMVTEFEKGWVYSGWWWIRARSSASCGWFLNSKIVGIEPSSLSCLADLSLRHMCHQRYQIWQSIEQTRWCRNFLVFLTIKAQTRETLSVTVTEGRERGRRWLGWWGAWWVGARKGWLTAVGEKSPLVGACHTTSADPEAHRRGNRNRRWGEWRIVTGLVGGHSGWVHQRRNRNRRWGERKRVTGLVGGHGGWAHRRGNRNRRWGE